MKLVYSLPIQDGLPSPSPSLVSLTYPSITGLFTPPTPRSREDHTKLGVRSGQVALFVGGAVVGGGLSSSPSSENMFIEGEVVGVAVVGASSSKRRMSR